MCAKSNTNFDECGGGDTVVSPKKAVSSDSDCELGEDGDDPEPEAFGKVVIRFNAFTIPGSKGASE